MKLRKLHEQFLQQLCLPNFLFRIQIQLQIHQSIQKNSETADQYKVLQTPLFRLISNDIDK